MITTEDFTLFKNYTDPNSYNSPEFSLTNQRKFSMNFHNGHEIVKIYEMNELDKYMNLFTEKFSSFTTAPCILYLKLHKFEDVSKNENSFYELYKNSPTIQKIHAYYKNIILNQYNDSVYIGPITQDDSGKKIDGDLGLGLFADRAFKKGEIVTSYGGTETSLSGGKFNCEDWDGTEIRSYGATAISSFPNVIYKIMNIEIGSVLFLEAIEDIQKDEPICAPYAKQAEFYGRTEKKLTKATGMGGTFRMVMGYEENPNSTWKYVETRPEAFKKFSLLKKSNQESVKDDGYEWKERYANEYSQNIGKEFD